MQKLSKFFIQTIKFVFHILHLLLAHLYFAQTCIHNSNTQYILLENTTCCAIYVILTLKHVNDRGTMQLFSNKTLLTSDFYIVFAMRRIKIDTVTISGYIF